MSSSDPRPANCRNRLRAEGKPHPKSSCQACPQRLVRGCPYEAAASPAPFVPIHVAPRLQPGETRLAFSRDGRNAIIHVRDGAVVYEGDMPVAESARIFFESVAAMKPTEGA